MRGGVGKQINISIRYRKTASMALLAKNKQQSPPNLMDS